MWSTNKVVVVVVVTYLTYLLPNLIFIHIIQGHLQEVIIMLNTQD